MKAVAYSVLAFEKEYFAKANKKKHDITLIANPLGMDTIHYAAGKEAIIMPEDYLISNELKQELCDMGIKLIIMRQAGSENADLQQLAEHTIAKLDAADEDNLLLPSS